jgi:cytochrome d ubiquinol oxidase subunit I
MQTVDWSRAQFAMTAIYHWLFVPLTLGLGVICAVMETKYFRSGDEFWKRTAKFWMKLFGINFAVGVATGIILEFEFGTNWSNYSHFVGDIFGAPLAIEGIMAFFLEATFLAVMFFGWNRVSKGFHLTSTWLVAVGASLSALWILVANAWMQYPVGTAFNIDTTRNEMTDFWAIIFSPVAVNKFFHTVLSGYVLASVFVLGISAWFLLRGRERRMALSSIKIAGWFGGAAALLLAFTGDGSGVQVARTQPMKLAAMEAHYEGSRGAPLVAFGILKPQHERGEDPFRWKIEIPKLLSFMSFHNFNAFVPGIGDLVYGNMAEGLMPVAEKMERGRVAIAGLGEYAAAKKAGDSTAMAALAARFDPSKPEGREFLDENYRYLGYGYLSEPEDTVPAVGLLFYSFRVMVGLGIYFILLFILVLWWQRRGTLEKPRWKLHAMLWSIPLAYIAGIAGWIVAEVGRQPWTIQDLLPTVAAVSKIGAKPVAVTFFLFVALFTALLIAEIRIMTRQIAKGPDDAQTQPSNAE